MAIFIVCHRNGLYQAQSILIARQKITGDKQNWWSLRPKEYRDLVRTPYWEQIAGQIYYTYKDIETSLAQVDRRQRVDIHYADLCTHPQTQVEKVVRAVEGLGVRVDWQPDIIPTQFEFTDVQRLDDAEFQRLHQAVKRYFPTTNLTLQTPS